MFKNLSFYKAAGISGQFDTLSRNAGMAPFRHCGPTAILSGGWTPPRDENGAMIESVAGHWFMAVTIETKSVPASAVDKRVKELAATVEQETGHKPGRKQSKDLKEQATLELLPAAFPKRTTVRIWIDPKRELLALDTASQKIADLVLTMVSAAAPEAKIGWVVTQDSPATIMHGWLLDGEADVDGWDLGRECGLALHDEQKPVVRYGKSNLDTDEIKTYCRSGYDVEKLGLTWGCRVGFVLTPDLVLKKLDFLDIVFEGKSRGHDDDQFDADMAIMAGELGPMIDGLIEALGGYYVDEQA